MICPVCANRSLIKPSETFDDYNYCPKCTACFAKPEKVVYTEKYFQQNKKRSLLAFLAAPLLNIFTISKVRYIKSLLPKNGQVLDYGCGSGKLVESLNKAGIKCVGYEPSLPAVRLAQKSGIPVFSELKPTKGGYDLIMLWHSLEHISNAGEIIKKLTKHLSPKGRLVIAVPNSDSWEAQLFKKRWFHYSYPLHCIQFNPNAMQILLNKNGLKHQKIDFFNPEYTVSGLVQTLLNLVLPMNVMYSTLTNRRAELSVRKALPLTLVSIFLVLIFIQELFVLYIILLIFKKTDAIVITSWR